MNSLKLAVLAAGVALAASSVDALAAGDLPPSVQQQIDGSIGVWASSGSIKSLGANIADLCRDNPGIALDIVAYAGEVAARSAPAAQCNRASQCDSLDELLAWLQQRAALEGGSGSQRAKKAPPACTSSNCEPPPCTAVVGCGPATPVSKSAL